jgi:hypothetical protein
MVWYSTGLQQSWVRIRLPPPPHSNHRQFFTFFLYPKNGAESLLESQIKYDFKKGLSLLSRRWTGLLCSQKGKNPLNREEVFFLKKDHVGYQKIRLFT